SVLGAGVPMVGGCAGDGLKMYRTFQFLGGRVLTGSVLAAGIASTGPLGIGVQHGWRPAGEPMLVTGSSPNQVDSLDDRPALDVFLERLGAEPGQFRPEDLPVLALLHPLGISRHSGEGQVRFITSADFARRSLSCTAQVPQGSLVCLMEADTSAVLAATTVACHQSVAALGGSVPLGMLAFDCVARSVCRDRVGAGAGTPEAGCPGRERPLIAADGARHELTVPGFGVCRAVTVSLDYPAGATFALARAGPHGGLRHDEASLFRGMARVTSMAMRTQHVLDDERAAREESDRQAAENARLLAELTQRQARLTELAGDQAALRRVATLVPASWGSAVQADADRILRA